MLSPNDRLAWVDRVVKFPLPPNMASQSPSQTKFLWFYVACPMRNEYSLRKHLSRSLTFCSHFLLALDRIKWEEYPGFVCVLIVVDSQDIINYSSYIPPP